MTTQTIFKTRRDKWRTMLKATGLTFALLMIGATPVMAENEVNATEINLPTLPYKSEDIGTSADDWYFDNRGGLFFNAGAGGKTYTLTDAHNTTPLITLYITSGVTSPITLKFDGNVSFFSLNVENTEPVTLTLTGTPGATLTLGYAYGVSTSIYITASSNITVTGGLQITDIANDDSGISFFSLSPSGSQLTIDEGSRFTANNNIITMNSSIINNGAVTINGKVYSDNSTITNNGVLAITGDVEGTLINNAGGAVVVTGVVKGISENNDASALAFKAVSVANHTPEGHWTPLHDLVTIDLSQELTANAYYSVSGNDITTLQAAYFTLTGSNANATFTDTHQSPVAINNVTLKGMSLTGTTLTISGASNTVGSGGIAKTRTGLNLTPLYLTGNSSLTVGANGNTGAIAFNCNLGISSSSTVTVNGNVDGIGQNVSIDGGALTVNGNLFSFTSNGGTTVINGSIENGLSVRGGNVTVNGYVSSIGSPDVFGATHTGTVVVTYHSPNKFTKVSAPMGSLKFTLIGNLNSSQSSPPDLAVEFNLYPDQISGIYVYGDNEWSGTIDWAAPTKPNFVLDGWYLSSFYGIKVLPLPTTFTQSVTYYARWKSPEYYTVTFAGEGVNLLPQTAEEGSRINCPRDPERANYNFGGWYTDNGTFLNKWDFETNVVIQAITLYAKWIQITGITEIGSAGLKIYPNPVGDVLQIESGGLRINRVEIVDLSGKTICQFNDLENQINVSALLQGMYFVRIETDNGIITRKFVKGY